MLFRRLVIGLVSCLIFSFLCLPPSVPLSSVSSHHRRVEAHCADDASLIADEHPAWVAARVQRFFEQDENPPPAIDQSFLDNKATLTVGYFGTLGNAASAGGA